jgi:hypothetical protein
VAYPAGIIRTIIEDDPVCYLPMSAGPTAPAPPRGRPLFGALVLLAGAALLVWQVRRMRLSGADLREGFADVGLWFLLILLLSGLRFVFRSLAWRIVMDRQVPLATMTAATISGDALGNITPFGFVAGEPAKALYLRRHVDPSRAFAALAAETFFYSVSVAVYVIVAAAAMFAFFDIRPEVELAGTFALGGMAVVLAGAAWLAWQRPALASATLAKLTGARAARWIDRLRTFEIEAYGAAGRQGGRLAAIAVCEIGFHALSFAECWLVFYLLSGETSLLPSLVFDGFNRVANIVFKPVPFRLGVEETGTALLAAAIGFPAHGGFLLALVRKVRLVFWAGVGLAMWGIRKA